jgi:hypothetical protein
VELVKVIVAVSIVFIGDIPSPLAEHHQTIKVRGADNMCRAGGRTAQPCQTAIHFLSMSGPFASARCVGLLEMP